MKKTFVFAALALCAAALAVSCEKKDFDQPVEQGKKMTIKCIIAPDSKVAISDAGKTTWSVNDEILIHGKWIGGQYSTIVTLAATDISADGKTATITFDEFTKGAASGNQASNLYAIYPASAVAADNGATNWRCVHPFNNTNLPLMVGYNKETDGTDFYFRNLCGVITFQVSGEFDGYDFEGNLGETVAYENYQAELYWTTDGAESSNYKKGGSALTKVSGEVTANGTTTNYVFLPAGANFSGGFTFKFKDGDDIVKVAKTETAVNVERSKILNLGDITSKLSDYVAPSNSSHKSAIADASDLSTGGTANCYVITAAGAYKFPVVKGNSDESAGNVFDVELLWETYNNTEEVTPNSVIAAVDFDGPDNEVYFQTPETLKPGNALIAAKNSEGVIIWSWHIWIPETSFTVESYNNILGANAMSRNLGALVDADGTAPAPAASCGLLYQWGRKDPFMGVGEMKANSSVKATTSKPFASRSTEQIAIATSIANPTMFAYNSATAGSPDYAGLNWTTDDNNSAWNNNGKKGLYDPCPAGYKVPVLDSSNAFWIKEDWTLDLTNFFYTKGGMVLPYAGYLDDCGGSFSHGGDRSAVWSSTNNGDTKGRSIDVRTSVSSPKDQYKARGNSVRCVVEAVVE